ncbi:MAG: protein translocase subunit SecD [Spirochaetia bacterium]|nr:protein translocase subunit SecD [Spirochaetia bacterium]
MSNSKSSFLIIFLVIAISVLFIWPNIGKKTVDVHFQPGLSEEQIHKSAESLKDYLSRYYSGRYEGSLVETSAAPEDMSKELPQDLKSKKEKEYIFRVTGKFVQAAFINELYRQPGVDPERIIVKKLWVEDNLKAKPFKLGLDLQGGMNLLMEADFDKLKRQLDERYPEQYIGGLKKRLEVEKDKNEKNKIKNELDQINRIMTFTSEQKKEYVQGAMEIIHSRIDKTGVAEPLIRVQGDDKIEISLPGVASPEQAKKIVSSTARVEYHLSEPVTNGEGRYQNAANSHFAKYVKIESEAQRYEYIKEVEKLINLPVQYGIYVYWSKDPEMKTKNTIPRQFLVLERKISMSGDDITPNTYVGFDQENVQNTVNFQLTPEGTKKFAKVTTENIGKFLAILIDDKVRSYPTIRSAIATGSAQISGDFSPQEAKDLALIIKEGSLPVPMKIVEERSIGPSLGKESIQNGVFAIALGMMGVAIYMILYYHIPGMISIFALSLNVLFMSALLAMIDYTITLPGLAGVVLTFGMIVDANVIIYERVREELGRGKSLKLALELAFEKSAITIFDSNLTTIVAAILLMQFGVGPIKGFAVTLCIGILTSLFTSLYVSKVVFSFLVYDLKVKKMSFGFGKYKKTDVIAAGGNSR